MSNLINLCFAWIAASLFVGPFTGAFLGKGLGRDEDPPEWFEPWMREGEERHKGSDQR
jgi:hypothetical protein